MDKVKKKAKENGVKVRTDVVLGTSSVVKEIVEYADKNKIDMIVIGSRGLSGIKKMLLGSVASGVVTYAHCPVLVTKWTFLVTNAKINWWEWKIKTVLSKF